MKTPQRPLGLYIHIPFCKQKCAYCDFYSLSGREERMEPYVEALCKDLTETARYTPGYAVDTVYFGGGTPTLLGQEHLRRILKTVKKSFSLTRDAEITLEANPDSAQDVKALKALRKAGFNRISLGMQSACDEELRRIGRIHTAAETAAAVAAIRKAGFTNLSLDLIYGLPGQTMERWEENLRAAVALAPEHLSCYGLKVEEGTPLFAQRDTADLPDDEAQADLYLFTVEFLSAMGYGQYEISNFAKHGKQSRHNLKYWRLQEYAGFGPGAHSDLGGVRYAYDRSLEGYITGIHSGTPSFSEQDRIPPADRDAEWFMLSLRTAEGLDPRDYENRFRRRFAPFRPFLEQCIAAGYALQTPQGRYALTPRGFLLSNQIIGELLDILAQDKLRRAEATARGDFRVEID